MNTDTTLILAGNGYELTIAPEAEKAKAALLEAATAVQHVRDNDESADAQYHLRSLASMRIAVEKSRKLVKEPVNRIGKLIDSTAANFVAEIEAEEKRINCLVGDHAQEVARLKRIKEEEERKAFEEARAAREALAEADTIANVIAANKARAARLAASEEVAATNVANGVRFTWDFEVDDIAAVFRAAPEFVEMNVKRSTVLAWLRETKASDEGIQAMASACGIRAFKKPVVSTR